MQYSVWEKGGISINITEAYKEHIEYTFNEETEVLFHEES